MIPTHTLALVPECLDVKALSITDVAPTDYVEVEFIEASPFPDVSMPCKFYLAPARSASALGAFWCVKGTPRRELANVHMYSLAISGNLGSNLLGSPAAPAMSATLDREDIGMVVKIPVLVNTREVRFGEELLVFVPVAAEQAGDKPKAAPVPITTASLAKRLKLG